MRSLELGIFCFAALCAASCASVQDDRTSGPLLGQGYVPDPRITEHVAEPASPVLKLVEGRVPLARVSQRPSNSRVDEPSFEFAVYDDGTVVYEGDRCVRLGGLIVKRLRVDDIHALKAYLEEACTALPSPIGEELCVERATVLRVTCSNGKRTISTTDRCARDPASNARVEALAQELLNRVGVSEWLGEPTDRQACTAGATGLAPGELRAARHRLDAR